MKYDKMLTVEDAYAYIFVKSCNRASDVNKLCDAIKNEAIDIYEGVDNFFILKSDLDNLMSL